MDYLTYGRTNMVKLFYTTYISVDIAHHETVFMTDLKVKKRVGRSWLIYVVSLALTARELKSLVFV